jgi:hypothetical protein
LFAVFIRKLVDNSCETVSYAHSYKSYFYIVSELLFIVSVPLVACSL